MNGKPNKFRILITGAAGFVGSHLAERLKKDGDEVVGLRSFNYIADILEGLTRIIEHFEKCPVEIINLGCDLQISVGTAIVEVEKALGKKVLIESVEARTGDQADTCANITKARALLGYEPRVYPEEGITRQVANHRKVNSTGKDEI